MKMSIESEIRQGLTMANLTACHQNELRIARRNGCDIAKVKEYHRRDVKAYYEYHRIIDMMNRAEEDARHMTNCVGGWSPI
jgi:hypothetical protein